MKKFFIAITSIIAVFAVTSCQNSLSPEMKKLKADLKDHVETTSPYENVDYKFISLECVDTILVADTLSSVATLLENIWIEPDIQNFRMYRNFDFELRDNPKQYEYDIMQGKYKDASPSCTDLRVITLIRDSIIEHWDEIKKYDYEYLHQTWLGLQRLFGFTENNSGEAYEAASKVVEQMPNIKILSDFYKEYSTKCPDDIFAYRFIYHYSIFDPLMNGRVKKQAIVTVDSQYNITDFVPKG